MRGATVNVERILNDILRLSSVFLNIDCGLLLEVLLIAGAMRSVYSRLGEFLHADFDATCMSLMIARSRSHQAISTCTW
jgi:hypothetical protein